MSESEEESLAHLEISDHNGLTLDIDIEKENFYDVVHYTVHTQSTEKSTEPFYCSSAH
ncbi:hypothetical protein DAPPUDRAFT_329034 [Daphnia pulex]|uniref:Uncharacterized protein n=1 Tax=Daphnia pulex TaxID=6669 RepID=E9HFG9_DAPPU|nr:hypothetical protein DAPPUDRAFT_329034 [Daphnia pulex]|eukprot:EFX69533.1 hypothetical protein DAPPUDRAFT_329034 [Daphnia pulex]